MIDHAHPLPVAYQAEALQISRSSVYYTVKLPTPADLELMRIIDRLHLDFPFAGARMLRGLLRREGYKVGRRHVATLMRLMGIQALYRKRSTSRRNPEHHVFPYLLRNLPIERASEPRVVRGYNVYSHAPGFSVPLCRARLVYAQSPRVAAFQQLND
jgi:putative transposase